MTLSDLVGTIDAEGEQGNLSSAIRLFVLEHYPARGNSRHKTEESSDLMLAPSASIM